MKKIKKIIANKNLPKTSIADIEMPDLDEVFLASQEHDIKNHSNTIEELGLVTREIDDASLEKSEKNNMDKDYPFITPWENLEDM